jgi:aryl-alcohol dehydrogenase-like predicted oxidoreductase
LEEKESLELLGKAYELGVNFFDTANVYSGGLSEEILGKAIKKFNMPRGCIVVATKAWAPVRPVDEPFTFDIPSDDPAYVNQFGLSRKHLFEAVDASLKRLDLDYIDLVNIYYIHFYYYYYYYYH